MQVQISLPSYELPVMEPSLQSAIQARMPSKGRFGIKRGRFLRHGDAGVRDHIRRIAIHDKTFDAWDVDARNEFYWDKGVGSTDFQGVKIFRDVRRIRRQGTRAVEDRLHQEYIQFRNFWLDKHYPQV